MGMYQNATRVALHDVAGWVHRKATGSHICEGAEGTGVDTHHIHERMGFWLLKWTNIWLANISSNIIS